MIRLATAADMPALIEMARAFHKAHGNSAFDPETTRAFIANALERGCVLFSEGSFLIGFLAPDPGQFGSLVAHEAFWWSSEGKGRDLREAFEAWGRSMGATEIQFSHPWEAKRVGDMLRRAGYVPATKVWRKVV